MKYFNKTDINWFGLDASNDMLEIANSKLENVSLIQANAENMPYSSSTFDFIVNNYALHHFKNKGQALTEIHRILKNDGIYKLHNNSTHDMSQWWVYYYFPSVYGEDLQ
ncbi:class I SAM-dependent methyltransferase [Salicibibacter halophilus]|nr:class I SAM-dependent methyltransferase [Salicibibacter halophilus]